MCIPEAQGRLWPHAGVAESTKRQALDTAPRTRLRMTKSLSSADSRRERASRALSTSSSSNVPRCDSDYALFELDRREFKISAVTASARRCTRSRSGELQVNYSMQSKSSVAPKQIQNGFTNMQAQQTEAVEAWAYQIDSRNPCFRNCVESASCQAKTAPIGDNRQAPTRKHGRHGMKRSSMCK